MTAGACHILGAALGDGEESRAHNRGKGLSEHAVPPS